MSARSSYPRAGQARPAGTPGAAEPAGPGARQRRPAAKGSRLAQAACGAGLAYAAVSMYWALGGTWLLDTVAGTLEQQGRAGNPGIILAVCAAAALKVIGAIVPLAAAGVTARQATNAVKRRARVLAWLEAAILTIYGLVLTVAGLLAQSGAIPAAASADPWALAWHACLWDPWFLLWGALAAAALPRSRQPGVTRIARGR
ncbi:MAG TPA: DUF3995 domain-containing protein [Streptosporangiaceae bacterium]|nr:DUF3995 domain-containing protein [Streptosporangiaceae bacterium]